MHRLRYVGVALVAGTVGAAVALLLAPDSGANTRRRMKKRLERERAMLAKRSRRAMQEASGYLEDQVDQGRKLAEGVADDVVARLEKGKRKITQLVR